jgi:toxin-antitoxin system PIN domain toxin
MRTTARLDDALLVRAKKEAARRGETLTSLIERGLTTARPCSTSSKGAGDVILPDVNVLLYAFRDDSVGHAAYRAWLEDVINGDEAYGMSSQVLCSVIWLATHPRVYVVPSRLDDALAFARVLLEQPHCTLVTPGARHYSIFEDLSRKSVANGNLVQDAWFAALAVEAGCDWITTDGDFARFHGLRWRRPF